MNIASPHSRRKFLGQLSTGLGSISVMDLNSKIEGAQTVTNDQRGLLETTHIPARAKRVIYLFQSRLKQVNNALGSGRYVCRLQQAALVVCYRLRAFDLTIQVHHRDAARAASL